MLQGSEIFKLFFEGTKGQDFDERGNPVTKNLLSQWNELEQYFTNALADISETTKERVKSQLEVWFEVLRNVMRMHALSTTNTNNAAEGGVADYFKKASQPVVSQDADDFYVFIYDEEDLSSFTNGQVQ